MPKIGLPKKESLTVGFKTSFSEISNGFQVVLYNEKIIEIETVEKILDAG